MKLFRDEVRARHADARAWVQRFAWMPVVVTKYRGHGSGYRTVAWLRDVWRRQSEDVLEIGHLKFVRYEYRVGIPVALPA